MSNPYESPEYPTRAPSDVDPAKAAAEVSGPAIGLMVVTTLAILLNLFTLVMNALQLSGAIPRPMRVDQDPALQQTLMTINLGWGFVVFCFACFILFGAIQMKRLKSFGLARAAAVVAVIPLISPCCLLGIPFGIWALVVLARPHVREAFD